MKLVAHVAAGVFLGLAGWSLREWWYIALSIVITLWIAAVIFNTVLPAIRRWETREHPDTPTPEVPEDVRQAVQRVLREDD